MIHVQNFSKQCLPTSLSFEPKQRAFHRNLEGEQETANNFHEAMVGRVRVSAKGRCDSLSNLSEYSPTITNFRDEGKWMHWQRYLEIPELTKSIFSTNTSIHFKTS